MSKRDTSKYVPQRSKIKFDLNIYNRLDLTEKQKKCLSLILDKETKMIFIKGPAGVSKSYLAVLAGLTLLQERKVSDLIYIRSIVESSPKQMGALPGSIEEKINPFLIPLMDKLEELLPENQIKALMDDQRIKGIPINYLRGANFAAKYIIFDEAQNAQISEIVTVATRLAEKSKMIILADPKQSDINKSGFIPFYNAFNDEESRQNGIHTFEFTKEDIVRSEILKFIVDKIENHIKS